MSGVVTLGQVAARLAMLEVSCTRCGRRGRLRIDRFLGGPRSDMPVPMLLRIIAADCPPLMAEQIHDTCGISAAQLQGIFFEAAVRVAPAWQADGTGVQWCCCPPTGDAMPDDHFPRSAWQKTSPVRLFELVGESDAVPWASSQRTSSSRASQDLAVPRR